MEAEIPEHHPISPAVKKSLFHAERREQEKKGSTL